MTFKCKIGLHSWNGCKCSECEKTRDEQHDWSKNCNKCSKCGKIGENKHDWSKDCERCSKCEKTRENQHNWTNDCEKCSKCGKKRENQHDWSKDCEKCSNCGNTRIGIHIWEKNNEKCSKCEVKYLEKICSQLYSEDLEVFYNTINVIKELANPEVIPYLQKYYLAVSDDLKWNRLVVGKTIAFIGKEISCDFFLSDIKRQLKNGNYSFRVCDSLQSIGNIEHAKAYDILLSIINNFEEFDSQIREWASISLHDSNCSKYKNEVLSELQTEDQQAFSDADITKERKDANELFDLGEKYYSGDGIPQNFIEAFRYFKFAADLGLVEAQFNIGLMFYNGHGVQQSYSEALKWYSLAADQGLEEAQYNIGCMFDKGYGVKQDYKEALKWYLLAANEDGESIVRARAIFNVGVFHRDGLGIPQNYNEAAKWTIKAAEMGYDEAQFNLGLMYLYGEGLPENINLAIRWWKFAAEQGNSNAKTNLAVFKSRGLY